MKLKKNKEIGEKRPKYENNKTEVNKKQREKLYFNKRKQ